MTDAAARSSAKSQALDGLAWVLGSISPRAAMQDGDWDPEQLRRVHDLAWTRILLISIFLGLFCVVVNGIGSQSAFAVGLLLSAASLAVGGLAGFLFGVPRSLQAPFVPAPSGNGQAEPGKQADDNAGRYATNTNLEQISDWLTKILVGVGLTQIGPIVEGLKSAAAYFGAALGEQGTALAFCVMVYFSIAGFFYTYLWTRLVLVGVMSRADQAASAKLRRMEAQDAVDLRAMTLVDRCLSGKISAEDAPELGDAIAAASERARKLIFYEAEEARTRSWRQNKSVVDRSVPVFRALVQTDRDGVYYKTKAKLAYALKDQRAPTADDLKEAISLLGDAIEQRDLRCKIAPLYEFNRAVCRMLLDEDFKQGRPSSAETRDLIAADLEAAAALRQNFADDPVARWLKLNGDAGSAEVTPIREPGAPVTGTAGLPIELGASGRR